MPAGTVHQLWRWPVKSMAGERLRSTRMDERGLGGDRTHAIEFEHKGAWRPLTAREAPRLLAWRAAYPFAADAAVAPDDPPVPTLTGPDGRVFRWGDPRLVHALTQDLGRPIRLRRDPAGIQDLERSVLITTTATARALAEELDTELDLRRFRTNLHLELDAPPWAEHGWEGATLRLGGGAVLRVLHPCVRCAIPTRDPTTQKKWPALLRHLDTRHERLFGINARVVEAGIVGQGDAVEITPHP